MSNSIEVDYDLPHPPDKVWRALTDSALVARWLMPNDLVPTVGHKFTFRTTPMMGWDGVVQCEVIAADAPRLLAYKWVGGIHGEQAFMSRLDTVVTWTLQATPTGTRLHLSHSGFTAKNALALDAMSKGWAMKEGGKLQAVLAEL